MNPSSCQIICISNKLEGKNQSFALRIYRQTQWPCAFVLLFTAFSAHAQSELRTGLLWTMLKWLVQWRVSSEEECVTSKATYSRQLPARIPEECLQCPAGIHSPTLRLNRLYLLLITHKGVTLGTSLACGT